MATNNTESTSSLTWLSTVLLITGTLGGTLALAALGVFLAMLDGVTAHLEAGGTLGGYGAAASAGADPSPVFGQSTWMAIIVAAAMIGGVSTYAGLSRLLISKQRRAGRR